MAIQIPEVVVLRLPLYARVLEALDEENHEMVSSLELGLKLGVTAAQIRKDLSYFGRFGRQGRGYNVKRLLAELKAILGLNRQWAMVLVGVGRLGRAIANYEGFDRQGFQVVAAFDGNPEKVGQKVDNLVIQDMSELADTVKKKKVDIGIVAVPASAAQKVIDALVAAGVKGILNYAPATPRVSPGVRMRDIDPVVGLESMTFYLKNQSPTQ